MPEVSVVIPSYNHASYISSAVESVLSQTFSDLELIIIDDGSRDNTLEVLSGFTDPRLQVFSQTNQGAHAAINRGLLQAAGRFLAILNSDDLYHPRRLEKALQAFQKDPELGLVGSHIEIIDTAGKSLGIKHGYQDASPWLLERPERSFRAGNDLRAALLTENYWSTTSNYVFPRRVYERVGEFRPLRYTHDWDFALRLARRASMQMLAEPLMQYRVHPANTIRENQAAMIFEICWILAVHLPEHTADQKFFAQEPLHTRVEQLLHSLYAFNMERVLNVMLLQNLHQDLPQALELLEPQNPVRLNYLSFIQEQLKAQDSAASSTAAPQDTLLTALCRALGGLYRKRNP